MRGQSGCSWGWQTQNIPRSVAYVFHVRLKPRAVLIEILTFSWLNEWGTLMRYISTLSIFISYQSGESKIDFPLTRLMENF